MEKTYKTESIINDVFSDAYKLVSVTRQNGVLHISETYKRKGEPNKRDTIVLKGEEIEKLHKFLSDMMESEPTK